MEPKPADEIIWGSDACWKGRFRVRDRTNQRFVIIIRLDHSLEGNLIRLYLNFPTFRYYFGTIDHQVRNTIVSLSDGSNSDFLPMNVCISMQLCFEENYVIFNGIRYRRSTLELMLFCYNPSGHM